MSKGNSPENNSQFDDMYAPYSQEKRGDLLEYLKSCDEYDTDNHFFGPENFQKIVELGLVSAGFTVVRVNQSPMPDAYYFVNNEYLLESHGLGGYNMSATSAAKGTYKPEDVLKNHHWSIHGLSFHQ